VVVVHTLRTYARQAVAVILAATAYAFVPAAAMPAVERAAAVTRFHFASAALPNPSARPAQRIRAVHPSLARIASWISSVGAAVALADIDNDGLPNDVCHVATTTDSVIVAPAPTRTAAYAPFELALETIPDFDPTTMAPMGCLPGDPNEDGRIDLLVYFWGHVPVVFLRTGAPVGSGSFTPVEIGRAPERWYTNAAAWADVDGDGHADLVVGNYFSDGARILDAHAGGVEAMPDSMSHAKNGGTKHVLLWTAAGAAGVTFTEADAGLGVSSRGWALALGAADLDGDLLPELYFANDFGPDDLFYNRSTPGRVRLERLEGSRTLFTPKSKVLGRDSFKGMGVDFGDLNGDLRPDIVVSNIAGAWSLEESHFAFLSTGDVRAMDRGVAPYVDQSESLGVSRSTWAWDLKLADFDNDRRLELVQTTGFIEGATNRWPELHELAMSNDQLLAHPAAWPHFQPGDGLSSGTHPTFSVAGSDGRFTDIAEDIGLGEAQVSRGCATGDVDGDGRLDFAIAQQWGASHLYHNLSTMQGQFIGLHLSRARGDHQRTRVRPGHPRPQDRGVPAIGAEVTVTLPDGRVLAGQVDGGNGHSGKRSPDLHFGLGNVPADAALEVQLAWRDLSGDVHRATRQLSPGWHTVLLGDNGR
jgi:hypothetical protein